ncbi:hypothetical protein D0867_03674 [Hortaea werneckii]|uniref:DUF7918 domain-containing protein n=2 Tax=Hortaea werneckii TaxID=91943 RepID=A0A3M7A0E4_HORWE|nr:hypothetical protein D0867_03674 [Hortaea werneckii]
MPKLKQLVCSIELGQNRTPLQEYGARYSDGAVESFVAVPDTKIPFCIRLKSEGYIAPGLAAFVFMDGQYQCNRNKLQLRMPDDGVPESNYEIDFCLRQKEEKTASGTFVGRQWSFAELNTAKSDKAANLNPRFLHNIGTIEVVVLRCKREGEDVPTPRLQAGLIPPVPPKAPSDRRITGPTQAPSAAPAAKAKQPTPAPSDALGGLFGLFDGACDEEEISLQHKKPIDTHLESVNTIGGLDGAGDFPAPYQHVPLPPVGGNGYVMPRAPDGYTWDPVVGKFLPVNEVGHYHPESQHGGVSEAERALKVRRDDRSAIHRPGKTASLDLFPVPVDANVDAALGNTDERGQLDGYGGPNVNIYQGWAWDNRGYDDMQGDHYFGMTGADRVNQKMKMREQGHDVSPSRAPIQHSIPQGYGRVANSMPQQYNAPQYSFQQGVARQSHGNPNVPIEFGILELQQKILDMRSRLVENNDETTDILEQLRANHGRLGSPSLMQRLEYLQNESDYLTKQLDVYSNGLNDYVQNASKNPDEEDLEILQKLRQMENDARTKKIPAAVPPIRYPTPAVNGWQQTGQGEVGRATTGKPPPPVERPGGLANKLNERYARVAAQNTQQSDAKKVQEAQQDWVNGPKAIDWAYEQPHGTGWTGSGKGHRTLPQEPRAVGNSWTDDDKAHQSSPQKPAAGGTGWADDDKGPQSSPQRAAVDNRGAPSSPQQWSGNDNAGSNGAIGQQQNNESWSGSASHRGRQQDNGGWTPAVSQQRPPHSHRRGSVYNPTSPSGKVNDAGWADGTVASDQGRREKTPSIFIQSPSPGAHVKSYWADWRQPTMPQDSPGHGMKKHEAARDPCDYPSAPLPTVPEGKLKDMKHGIQAGKGANYSHRCHRPLYMDTMAEPYAVFSFKYRSKEALEKILKRDVSSDVQATVKQAEEEKFLNMPKHKLVKELMKMRLPGGSPSPKKALTDSAASGWGGGADTRGVAGNGWDNQSNGGKQTHVGGWDEQSAHGRGHSSSKSVHSISKGYAANAGWDDPQPQQADNVAWGGNTIAANAWGGNSARESNNQAGWANNTPAAGGGWDGAASWKPVRYKAPAVHDIDSEGSLATGFTRSSSSSPVPVHNFGGFAERQKLAHHDGPVSPIAENAGVGAGGGALRGQEHFGPGNPGANYPGFSSAGQGLLPWGGANGYDLSENPMKKWEKGGWAREMVEGVPKTK